ncbi:MAG: hypothetical protein ACE5K0_00105 [Candidatus Methanofastidiosia archaeon]
MIQIELKNFEDFKRISHGRDLYVEREDEKFIYHALVKNQDFEIIYIYRSPQELESTTFFDFDTKDVLVAENIYEIVGMREMEKKEYKTIKASLSTENNDKLQLHNP